MTKTRFVESGSDGGFRRVVADGAVRTQTRRAPRAIDGAADDRGSMRAVVVAAQSTTVWLGFTAQGLLGGFAALNLFMTYLLDAPNLPGGSPDSGFLKYYSPLAVACQRVYVTLAVLSLLTSVDKYAKDSLGGFMLQGAAMQRVDAAAVLSFTLVFILSIVAVPFEDTLYFAHKRIPNWWEFEPLNAGFKTKLTRYHALNFSRCFFALVGWLAVCYTATPAVVDVMERAEEATRAAEGGVGGGVTSKGVTSSHAPSPGAGWSAGGGTASGSQWEHSRGDAREVRRR